MKANYLFTALLVGATAMLATSCIVIVNNGDSEGRSISKSKPKKITKKALAATRPVSERVSLATLHSVSADMGIHVVFVQKDTIPTAYIEARLLPGHELEYKGADQGKLKLSIKGKQQNDYNRASVRIVAPTLESVELTLGARFTATTVKTPYFTATGATGAIFSIDNLETQQGAQFFGSTGTIYTLGTLHTEADVEATMSTAAHFTTKKLSAKTLGVSANTGAFITIKHLNAQHVSASANTGSGITLKGATKTANIEKDPLTGGDISTKSLIIGD